MASPWVFPANRQKKRADERTRTAYPCSLRVISQGLQGVAQACRLRLDKLVSFLCLALCCTVWRSRWCQSGVNRVRISCVGVVWLRRASCYVGEGDGAKWQLLYKDGGNEGDRQ